MKNKLIETFVEDKTINITWKELENGDKKPIVKYKNIKFKSPSKLLSYKSSQIYQEAMSYGKNYEIAIAKGKKLHRLFQLYNEEKIPVILSQQDQDFVNAIEKVYEEYKLEPLLAEMVLWDETTQTMCIVDGIAKDKDGKLYVLELKTPNTFDVHKKLISFFQTHIAKKIILNKTDIKEIVPLTLHYHQPLKKLSVYDANNYNLKSLEIVLSNILEVEKEWNKLVDTIKNETKSKLENILEKIKEKE